MKMYGRVDVYIHVFLNSEIEVSGQYHSPASLPPSERAPNTHWKGDWVGPSSGLDDVEKKKDLSLTETRTPIPRSSNP
jgi:hypothetical protein